MSKKGSYIYQQIELTTAEWATNTTVYPASVWLFERLDSGKFNMKLADGVHTFAELATVMQDTVVSVVTNSATEYVLKFTFAGGEITTPNLRGQDGATYDDTVVRALITQLAGTVPVHLSDLLHDITIVTTLTDLPIANYSIKVTLAAVSALSFADTPAEGVEFMIDVLNTSDADIDQPLPNATGWQCNEESVTLIAGAVTCISVRYIHGVFVVVV